MMFDRKRAGRWMYWIYFASMFAAAAAVGFATWGPWSLVVVLGIAAVMAWCTVKTI